MSSPEEETIFVFTPSSTLGGPRTVRESLLEAQPLTDHFVDPGLPIPESYDFEIARAMLQDPFHIFLYWQVRSASFQPLSNYFSDEDAKTFRVTLRLTELKGGHEAYFEVAPRGRYWLTVFPDREYRFEVGLLSPVHGYISMIRSNRVQTPRGTVSTQKAAEPNYRLTTPEFTSVLRASGFAADQAVALAVDAALGDTARLTALGEVVSKLPPSVRAAIATAVAGDPLDLDAILALPEPLRGELLRLFRPGDGLLAAAALMHHLPAYLREAVESDRKWIAQSVHPLHFAPRFFQGGSENVSAPHEEFRWPRLPSSWDMVR
jgi:Domain of unknown function (DUF4912)